MTSFRSSTMLFCTTLCTYSLGRQYLRCLSSEMTLALLSHIGDCCRSIQLRLSRFFYRDFLAVNRYYLRRIRLSFESVLSRTWVNFVSLRTLESLFLVLALFGSESNALLGYLLSSFKFEGVGMSAVADYFLPSVYNNSFLGKGGLEPLC